MWSIKLENYSVRELEDELERRYEEKKALPDFIHFDAYLHNGYTVGEWVDYIEETTGYLINDNLARSISNYLYEIKIPLILNVKTSVVMEARELNDH